MDLCRACVKQSQSNHVQGIIIGHDKRKGAPGTDTLDHIRDCVDQCKAVGSNWYVKQVWDNGQLRHHAKSAEYAVFPADLKGGRLPWSRPEGA